MTSVEELIQESKGDTLVDEVKKKFCQSNNPDDNALGYLSDEKPYSEAVESVTDNCLPTESCPSWLPARTKNFKGSTQMSSCVTALGSSHILPLFTSHPEKKYLHLKKEIQASKLTSLYSERILSTLEKFRKIKKGSQCSSSLLTHLAHQAALRALHRNALQRESQQLCTPIKKNTCDVDIPPVFYKDIQSALNTSVNRISPRARFELVYSSVEGFREKTIITFKKYCFRVLRHLNIIIPSWGSFNDSFQWHSHCILNASSIQDISNYVIIFEDIMENVSFRLAEAQKNLDGQTHDCTSLADSSEKEKNWSGLFNVLQSNSETKDETSLNVCGASIRQEESEHSPRKCIGPLKNSIFSHNALFKQSITTMLLRIPLLTSLMYQVDAEIIARCILHLDLIRQRTDIRFISLPNLDEIMKSFLAQQNIHSMTQSPLHFLLDKSLVFRSVVNSNFNSSRRNRRRASAIQYPPYARSSLQREGNSDTPQASQSKYPRIDNKKKSFFFF